MKDFIKKLLGYILVFFGVCIMLFVIHFVFIYSYDLNEERLLLQRCDGYAINAHGSTIKGLNSFVYNEEKYFACGINDFYERLVILDWQNNVIMRFNYQSIMSYVNTLPSGSFGMYQDKVVYVVKELDEQLEIKYYDIIEEKLVFSMQGEEIADGKEMVE